MARPKNPVQRERKVTSFTFEPEVLRQLKAIAETDPDGANQSAVMRRLIRREYKRLNLESEKEPRKD